MSLFQFTECEKIIIFGSSKNLITANYWKKKDGHAWVMINHAWQIRERNNDWDKIVCSKKYLYGDEGDKNLKPHVDNIPQRYGDYMDLFEYPTLRKKYNSFLKGEIDVADMFFNACYYGNLHNMSYFQY